MNAIARKADGLPEIATHLPRRGPLATAEAVTAIARRAEELGYHSVWGSDHIAFPWPDTEASAAFTRANHISWKADTPWIDMFVALTWAGAVTKRIKLGTSVLILALRHPLAVAKTVSTLDAFTGGRVMLGIGAGWLEGEFDLLDQSFENRGPRTTEGIRLMKACWRDERIEAKGKHYNLPPFAMEPKPAQRGNLPIYGGGYADPALRRAAEACDGWLPSHLSPEEYAAKLPKLREYLDRAGRPMSGFTLGITGMGPWDDLTYDVARRYADAGVSLIAADCDFSGTLDDALTSLETVARTVKLI